LAAAEGQAVLASCDAGQVSFEHSSLGHGVFTHFLLEAMKGNASADNRGFITLGAVSDYVARSVQDWGIRHRPGLDRSTVQHPWFKGPKIAEQIPLAVDPGIRARLGAFKQDIVTTVSALRGKINRKGEFTTAVYDRLADALEQAQDDEAGRNLLKKSRDFAAGKLDEDAFVAYLERVLETPEQRTSRLAREAAVNVPAIVVTNPPATAEPKPRVHVVAKGDTIYSIAYRYYGSRDAWEKVYQANRDALHNKEDLRVGQKLVIP